jgi:preprotein translocase subunit SecF
LTQLVLIGLGILIGVLTVVAVLDLLPPLRIVPDDTHFDFTRFAASAFQSRQLSRSSRLSCSLPTA